MAEKKLTTDQVAEIVDFEGLGYAIQSYLGADRIEDEKLAHMWKEAAELLDRIEAHLESSQ
jgi:hypothetical protein